MARKTQTIEQLDASIKRWKTRLRRAVNTLGTLEKKRNRLAAKATVSAALDPVLEQLGALTIRPKAEAVPASTLVAAVKGHIARVKVTSEPVANPDNVRLTFEPVPDIPDFLRRGQAAQKAVDQVIADGIREEQAATKKAKAQGRIAKMKAKKAGDLKKMPLSGKAALDAIRNG